MDVQTLSPTTFEALKAGLDVRAAGRIVAARPDAFCSGFPVLDRALGGGFLRGAVATLEGPPTSGRTAIAASLLAQATRAGLAAIVDDGTLYPPGLERAGVRLDRVLIVQAHSPLETARSADILLRAQCFEALAMPAVPLRATVWSRLCGLAQKAGTVVFALGAHAGTELAYFASTRVRCGVERVLWSGDAGLLADVAGYDVGAQILKNRRAAPGAVARIRILRESSGAPLRGGRAAASAPRPLQVAQAVS
ncbi:MAG TPA: hypothetical protein VFA29_15370 [Candidatus Baltobacteraceae bacterium]|nr:hypothetical protein [Candidatus Baltobacteraceae bacterium]